MEACQRLLSSNEQNQGHAVWRPLMRMMWRWWNKWPKAEAIRSLIRECSTLSRPPQFSASYHCLICGAVGQQIVEINRFRVTTPLKTRQKTKQRLKQNLGLSQGRAPFKKPRLIANQALRHPTYSLTPDGVCLFVSRTSVHKLHSHLDDNTVELTFCVSYVLVTAFVIPN